MPNYVVSGAAFDNGTYVEAGTFGGYPYYQLTSILQMY